MLPYRVDYVPYTAIHVVFYLQLLPFSGLAFFLMLDWLKRTLTITLDIDWLYRRLGVSLMRALDRTADAAWLAIVSVATRSAHGIAAAVRYHHGPGHSCSNVADGCDGILDDSGAARGSRLSYLRRRRWKPHQHDARR
jgi:hypothetical protein